MLGIGRDRKNVMVNRHQWCRICIAIDLFCILLGCFAIEASARLENPNHFIITKVLNELYGRYPFHISVQDVCYESE